MFDLYAPYLSALHAQGPKPKLPPNSSFSCLMALYIRRTSYISSPVPQVRMIYPPFPANILARPYNHIAGRGNVDDRSFPWVGIRYPYRDWKRVRCPSESYW